MNNHYVSRFLTKPWEYDKRELRIYCPKKKTIYMASSKSAFSAKNIFDKKQEKFLGDNVEVKIGKIRKSLLENGSFPRYDKYDYFKAINLYFLFQFKRYCLVESLGSSILNIINQRDGLNINKLLDLTENDLNIISEIFRDEFKIISAVLPDNHYSFFPELGYYTVPVFCILTVKQGHAFVLPLTEKLSICLVPRYIEKLVPNFKDTLSFFSLTQLKRRLVIPQAFQSLSNEEVVRQINNYI